MEKNDRFNKDQDPVSFREILRKIATSEDSDIAAFAEALLSANMEMFKEWRKSASDLLKELMDMAREQIVLKDPRAYDIEEKRLELEHQREMLKLDLEKATKLMSMWVGIERFVQEHHDRRYERLLEIQMGFWGFKTKSKMLMAEMMSASDASRLRSRFQEFLGGADSVLAGLLEGKIPLRLPAPEPKNERKKTKLARLLEALDEEEKE